MNTPLAFSRYLVFAMEGKKKKSIIPVKKRRQPVVEAQFQMAAWLFIRV